MPVNDIRSIAAHQPAPLSTAALVRAQERLGRTTQEPRAALIRRTAEGMSAAMFYAPMLDQMRSDPIGRKFAHGGRGEDAFGQMLDQRIAAATAAADRGGLTAQIESWIGRSDARQEPRVAGTTRTEGMETWA